MDSASERRSQIAKNGFGLSMTHGISMRPLIWGGRHCVAVAPLGGELKVGDMLMFVQKQGDHEISVVHRLIEIRRHGDRNLYVTRGDNCLVGETVRPEEVIGRVVEVHRIGGYRPWYVIGSEKFTVEDAAYLRYTRIWSAIWPVRRIYYKIRGRLDAMRARYIPIFRKER